MPTIRHRIHRRLNDAQRRRQRKILSGVELEKSRIQARGRAALQAHDRLQQTLQLLRAARDRRGLTLSEISRRSGIDRARLSRLERDARANPTLETLSRIARATGAELRITVV